MTTTTMLLTIAQLTRATRGSPTRTAWWTAPPSAATAAQANTMRQYRDAGVPRGTRTAR
jgi:hypothetical protein